MNTSEPPLSFIRIECDSDLFGAEDLSGVDVSASLDAYIAAVEGAVEAAYPGASCEVDMQRGVSGRPFRVHAYTKGGRLHGERIDDWRTEAAIKEVANRAWEQWLATGIVFANAG